MKDTYYFSHDSNANQDPKILAMRSVYGWEGYGWYWLLVEMLREQEDYRINIQGNTLSMRSHCKCIAPMMRRITLLMIALMSLNYLSLMDSVFGVIHFLKEWKKRREVTKSKEVS